MLDEKTNDRSLVMTSSFTNLVLAGRALGTARAQASRGARERLARAAAACCASADGLAAWPAASFGSASISAAAAGSDPRGSRRSRCSR